MTKLVAAHAQLQCSMGSAPSALALQPTSKTHCANQLAATVQDYVANTNIMPFGMCQSLSNPQVASATAAANGVLTPQPCVPVTTAPWSPGASSVCIANQAALSDDSQCNCQWNGVITITTPGQQNTAMG